MHKHAHSKRLSKRMSEKAKRGWRTRRLIMKAEPRLKSADEVFEQAMRDRKGKHYDTWTKTNLCSIDIYHALQGRSDQFDVTIWKPTGNGQIKTTKTNLSKPKLLKLWSEL